jgi:hypothetical protein
MRRTKRVFFVTIDGESRKIAKREASCPLFRASRMLFRRIMGEGNPNPGGRHSRQWGGRMQRRANRNRDLRPSA